jgi:hypothetical protein
MPGVKITSLPIASLSPSDVIPAGRLGSLTVGIQGSELLNKISTASLINVVNSDSINLQWDSTTRTLSAAIEPSLLAALQTLNTSNMTQSFQKQAILEQRISNATYVPGMYGADWSEGYKHFLAPAPSFSSGAQTIYSRPFTHTVFNSDSLAGLNAGGFRLDPGYYYIEYESSIFVGNGENQQNSVFFTINKRSDGSVVASSIPETVGEQSANNIKPFRFSTAFQTGGISETYDIKMVVGHNVIPPLAPGTGLISERNPYPAHMYASVPSSGEHVIGKIHINQLLEIPPLFI